VFDTNLYFVCVVLEQTTNLYLFVGVTRGKKIQGGKRDETQKRRDPKDNKPTKTQPTTKNPKKNQKKPTRKNKSILGEKNFFFLLLAFAFTQKQNTDDVIQPTFPSIIRLSLLSDRVFGCMRWCVCFFLSKKGVRRTQKRLSSVKK